MWVNHRVMLATAAGAMGVVLAVGVAFAPAAGASTRAATGAATGARSGASTHPSFVGGFKTITTVASAIPKNGDLNPYGVAVVTRSKNRLHKGDVLVSNFNNKANTQGTGTTIVEMAPNHRVRVFAQINAARLPGVCPGGIGLSTALAVLGNDWVVVGSLPTVAGNPATAKAGCLLVLNSEGRVVETFHSHGINGPWDMTAVSKRGISALFVTNVLNGTVGADGKVVHRGTVLRLMVTTPAVGLPRLIAATTIGSGFAEERAQERCSAWRWRHTATASTSSTTRPTRWTCCTKPAQRKRLIRSCRHSSKPAEVDGQTNARASWATAATSSTQRSRGSSIAGLCVITVTANRVNMK